LRVHAVGSAERRWWRLMRTPARTSTTYSPPVAPSTVAWSASVAALARWPAGPSAWCLTAGCWSTAQSSSRHRRSLRRRRQQHHHRRRHHRRRQQHRHYDLTLGTRRRTRSLEGGPCYHPGNRDQATQETRRRSMSGPPGPGHCQVSPLQSREHWVTSA
jgi:hypothetical protein